MAWLINVDSVHHVDQAFGGDAVFGDDFRSCGGRSRSKLCPPAGLTVLVSDGACVLRVTCLGADPLVSLSCLAVGFFRSAGASMFTLFHVGARRMPLVVRGRDASENVEALNH